MTKKTNQKEYIDLLEIFTLLIRRWWILLLSALVVGAAAFGYTYVFIPPLYQSSALMYVNNSNISLGSTSFTISNADLTAAQKLVETYVVILKSRNALNEVISEAGLEYSYEELRGMISAASVNSTEVFEVIVTSKNPYEAEKIANTIANVLPDKIAAIVDGSDVRIVDYAVIPSHRHSPSYTRNTAVGVVIGVILSAAILILIHLLDENIRSEDYLTDTYPDIPLLAVIPDMLSSKQRGGYYYRYGGYETELPGDNSGEQRKRRLSRKEKGA